MQKFELANYACSPEKSRGRFYKESAYLDFVSPFTLDRSYITESKSFRRLAHKTQVFISNKGDYYRNRLTHSIEASHIARIISGSLGLSTELSENLVLAHDIGHAPFGHAGERALNQIMQKYGLEFDHNTHAIKLITELEERNPNFPGLNLTWEFIEGMAKHNGPLFNPSPLIMAYSDKHDLDLKNYPSLEAQIASIADDIAYNNHDIDDGFKAGFIQIEELKELSILGDIIKKIEKEYKKIEKHKLIQKTVQHMKNAMIVDVIYQTKSNIKNFSIQTDQDVRSIDKNLAEFSKEMEKYHQEIKNFLMKHVYKNHAMVKINNKVSRILQDLFAFYMDDYKNLPYSWQNNIKSSDKQQQAIVICDFLACMSDRHALAEYKSLFELP